MRPAGHTRAGQINKPPNRVNKLQNRAKWFRLMLLAGCTACAGWIIFAQPGQSGQPAQSPTSGQQSGNGQQHGSDQQAPSSQQQPMVMGESPDSQDNSSGTPASAAPASTQAPNKPAVTQPAPWNPATQTPEDAGARSLPAGAGQPAQPPAPTAAPASSPDLQPIIHVADAGGDLARQQINNECADLQKMANDLKSQVDKTTKDMLSIAVIRKANEIEQLAHRVRDNMRPEVGKN